MTIHFRIENETIIVFGQTFPHKDKIKDCGARFNGIDKTWVLPYSDEALSRIEELCKKSGGGAIVPVALQVTPSQPTHALHKASVSSSAVISSPIKEEEVRPFGVRDLMQQVSMSLLRAFPAPVWIVGEIQNLTIKNTAYFFSLAEPKEEAEHTATLAVKATLWRAKLRDIVTHRGRDIEDSVLVESAKVRLLVQVQLYQDRGHISLNVLDVDPAFTKGSLALAREKLMRELREKGLHLANKQCFMSPFPLRVGLISAEGSRAYSDFIDQLFSYRFPGEVLFYPAAMQGEEVSKDVCRGLSVLEKQGCNVIIVTRGGGSAADLRWFDDRGIALAIASASVPVIAAIGHHEDVSVAEEICYLRQKTPTAAADYLVHLIQVTRERLMELSLKLAKVLSERVADEERLMGYLPTRLIQMATMRFGMEQERLAQNAGRVIHTATERLNQAEGRSAQYLHRIERLVATRFSEDANRLQRQQITLERNIQDVLLRKREVLVSLETRLKSLDPSPWLEKGWTKLIFANGRNVRSVNDAEINDKARAILIDGELELEVINKKKRTPHG